MKLTWSTACGGCTGRVRFQGDKKRPVEGEDLNALVANNVKSVLNTNTLKNSKASSNSESEDKQENFNLETIEIEEESPISCTSRVNDAETPEEGTDTEKELYTISHLINPN